MYTEPFPLCNRPATFCSLDDLSPREGERASTPCTCSLSRYLRSPLPTSLPLPSTTPLPRRHPYPDNASPHPPTSSLSCSLLALVSTCARACLGIFVPATLSSAHAPPAGKLEMKAEGFLSHPVPGTSTCPSTVTAYTLPGRSAWTSVVVEAQHQHHPAEEFCSVCRTPASLPAGSYDNDNDYMDIRPDHPPSSPPHHPPAARSISSPTFASSTTSSTTVPCLSHTFSSRREQQAGVEPPPGTASSSAHIPILASSSSARVAPPSSSSALTPAPLPSSRSKRLRRKARVRAAPIEREDDSDAPPVSKVAPHHCDADELGLYDNSDGGEEIHNNPLLHTQEVEEEEEERLVIRLPAAAP
ncbi:hypothetical protein CONPUDRAFT_160564 [Coniophora puteana RWD-64-598 SS2]|uniref:Uncharacterized protein n=1 Tax=Coniophora puteana (strain RWD-64-598) TaxID=741705 RepID=R7SCP6_CONPW|nr:uncharacterized protein CONPUDRAFT_160564 [Coniophora puteana RWD-64-598 SS2]EIW73933.1 hypothetical protein CONPUDRAFT_160564 [Coniophora puteana RWD-64-598 SS2]